MASWPAKDPDEVLDYGLTWAKQMARDSDTIAAYAPFVSEGTVEVIPDADPVNPGKGPSFDATNTLVWLRGGAVGDVCKIVNRITTTAGRSYDHTRTIKIKDR